MSGQFRIVASPFGYPMYAAPAITADGFSNWSDNPAEAAIYDERDNPDIKLKFWRALLAGAGVDASSVAVEAI